jgi:hypothetical protein
VTRYAALIGTLLMFPTAFTATTYAFEFDAGLNVVVVKIVRDPKAGMFVPDPLAV